MYCVVYRFQILPGKQRDFERAWTELTDAIYQHSGGLGSSLHRSEDHSYMAYAQWPSKNAWDESAKKLPAWAEAIKDRMKSCCLSMETVFAGERISDLLKNAPSGNL